MEGNDGLNDDDIKRLFGIEQPDFGQGGEEVPDCCQYHVLEFVRDRLKAGGSFTPAERKALVPLIEKTMDDTVKGVQQQVPGDVSAQIASALGALLSDAVPPTHEHETERGVKIQAVIPGLRISFGGKDVTIPPRDSVILAGIVSGWVWHDEGMKAQWVEAYKKGKKQSDDKANEEGE